MNRVLVLLLLLCGSLNCTAPNDGFEAQTDRLVGAWRSEPDETQLGLSVETFCFRNDGTVNVTNMTQAGLLENHGAYSFDGARLSLVWTSGTSATAEAQLRSNVLLIKSKRGWRRYRKIETAC